MDKARPSVLFPMVGENLSMGPRTSQSRKAKLGYLWDFTARCKVEVACLIRIGKNHDKIRIRLQNKVITRESLNHDAHANINEHMKDFTSLFANGSW